MNARRKADGSTAPLPGYSGRTDRQSIAERVVEALAAAEGVSPIDLDEPLYESVDAEALDALFAPQLDGSPRSGEGHVEFSSNGYRVVVGKDGDVLLCPST